MTREDRMLNAHFSQLLKCLSLLLIAGIFLTCSTGPGGMKNGKAGGHAYNGSYTGNNLSRIAFPIGGIGSGMYCIEGSGAVSHMSVRNQPDIFNEPTCFAAVCIKGTDGTGNIARVVEGPIPEWKYFGLRGSGNGSAGSSYGLPRYDNCTFKTEFPFCTIDLEDDDIVFETSMTCWSPFIPGDEDNSSLPVGAMEYTFKNTSGTAREAVFSYNSRNFMEMARNEGRVLPIRNGFVLYQEGSEDKPQKEGAFAVFVNDDNAVVDHCWFRGGWWDAITLAWRHVEEGILKDNPPVDMNAPGASVYVPFILQPGEERTIRVMTAWFAPYTDIRIGRDPENAPEPVDCGLECCDNRKYHLPWYAAKFKDIHQVADYWRASYDDLRDRSKIFTDTFYSMSLPPEVIEAVAANLTILKSPTVRRQCDGRLWCFEGCGDTSGCCHGSCTHVWNYAQAIPHLFPELERSLRQTEFHESQFEDGGQIFRSNLPIREYAGNYTAASDGQLGGIMKIYREWRISGNTAWLKEFWPLVKKSFDYCQKAWDPRETGLLEESHHNTYDINYWGPDGHCGSFYLGAMAAMIEMGKAMGDDTSRYEALLEKGKKYLLADLWNGEYFIQKVEWEGYNEEFKPLDPADNGDGYTDTVELLNTQGPKYQYGTGCLSDGVLGFWIADMCGLDGNIVDSEKIKSHLLSVYKYNLKYDLTEHVNPQRPTFAMGIDGGLLLCSWPNGGKPALPFVYSDEVWTGIEYQVASHLMLLGEVEKGLEIVRVCRDRYDGTRRNPFNEYECGSWYARALASYGLMQGLTGIRYDAVDKTLYIDSKIGNNFRCFLATNTGYGTAGLKNGKPFLDVASGTIKVDQVIVSGEKTSL